MPDTTPTTEDRTRIADALAEADGWEWAEGFDKTQSPSYQGYLRQADAVLAVLPEPPARLVLGTTDQQPATAPVPVDRAAVLREAADAVDHLRATMLAPTVRDCYANGLGGAAARLRRLADEAQQPETGVYARDPECETGDVRTCTTVCNVHGEPAAVQPDTETEADTR